VDNLEFAVDITQTTRLTPGRIRRKKPNSFMIPHIPPATQQSMSNATRDMLTLYSSFSAFLPVRRNTDAITDGLSQWYVYKTPDLLRATGLPPCRWPSHAQPHPLKLRQYKASKPLERRPEKPNSFMTPHIPPATQQSMSNATRDMLTLYSSFSAFLPVRRNTDATRFGHNINSVYWHGVESK
jgi:hypothetical protein